MIYISKRSNLFLVLFMLVLTGCLDFGDDIETATVMKDIKEKGNYIIDKKKLEKINVDFFHRQVSHSRKGLSPAQSASELTARPAQRVISVMDELEAAATVLTMDMDSELGGGVVILILTQRLKGAYYLSDQRFGMSKTPKIFA